MNVKSVINEVIIMAILIVVIIIAAYMLFYNHIPKMVEIPKNSKYERADEIDNALAEIEEAVEDKSILNTYTGQTIYKRKYESGKVNPFDRDPNSLYVKDGDVTASQGNTTQGASGGSTGSTSQSGGKLTTTTGK